MIPPSRATLLGSPLGDLASIDQYLEEKVKTLQLMGSRFQHLSSHDSLFLLRHSFSIPRLHYLLRTAPCFLSDVLIKYDNVLREILGAITNVLLPADDPAWLQASLPVKLGGLGIRRATQIAPSAYLASSTAPADLVSTISVLPLISSDSSR